MPVWSRVGVSSQLPLWWFAQVKGWVSHLPFGLGSPNPENVWCLRPPQNADVPFGFHLTTYQKKVPSTNAKSSRPRPATFWSEVKTCFQTCASTSKPTAAVLFCSIEPSADTQHGRPPDDFAKSEQQKTAASCEMRSNSQEAQFG